MELFYVLIEMICMALATDTKADMHRVQPHVTTSTLHIWLQTCVSRSVAVQFLLFSMRPRTIYNLLSSQ